MYSNDLAGVDDVPKLTEVAVSEDMSLSVNDSVVLVDSGRDDSPEPRCWKGPGNWRGVTARRELSLLMKFEFSGRYCGQTY